MKLVLRLLAALLVLLSLLSGAAGFWYVWTKLPQRSGDLALPGLQAPVSVRYDDRGIPHIRAANEADLYRALGFVHAQDRLFQMEMLRRLANGELSEVLGSKTLKLDRLFRTLGLRTHAAQVLATLDVNSPAVQAQQAYLDGVNEFLRSRPAPMEFDLAGIAKRPFTLQDTLAVSGYLAYSFAAALKTDPVLSFVHDELDAEYLQLFDLEWNPLGVTSEPGRATAARANGPLLSELAQLSQQAQELAGVPLLEGSNAWVVSGQHTSSGKPMLAGDPHIGFALPAVWYEAHLNAPGFELYGHFQALNALALLGHNTQFGWSLTMFQNDDMDLVAETANSLKPGHVRIKGEWFALVTHQETIQVKGAAPVKLTVQQSPHGPIISNALQDTLGEAPVALWWTFLQSDNPLLQAFYELNRADTLAKARAAASKIHAPGLNVLWASARGDIGWWAGARLPIRPAGVNPVFILDGETGEADKLGYYRFADNPQEENPPRGYIASANQQPISTSGLPIPGYYNLPDRAQALVDRLSNPELQWNVLNAQSLQLSTQTGYFWRVLEPLLPALSDVVRDPLERSVFDSLVQWDGQYSTLNIPPTVFNQFLYELARAALADELGPAQFQNLLGTRALDHALPRLAGNEASPWWDNTKTQAKESRQDIVRAAWRASMAHLRQHLGKSPNDWGWGRAHTLTHQHPLGKLPGLGWLLNVGPLEVAGAREVPNNMGQPIGPAPWAVSFGPSTRRIVDFSDPAQALGINPVGQSGVPLDRHYKDQAAAYAVGGYMQQFLAEKDVLPNTRSTLTLRPARAPAKGTAGG